MSDLGRLIDILAATAEVCGTDMKPAALAIMAGDLSAYPLEQVEVALARVRAELKGRLTLAAILERMSDGRPEPDEAWAIALTAEDEAETVVWTREMAEAFSVARPVLEMGDKVGARMAFKSAYERLVGESRASKAQAEWSVSLGWDAGKREAALEQAVDAKRLTRDAASRFLPAPREAGQVVALLTGKTSSSSLPKTIHERCLELRSTLVAGKAEQERRRVERAEENIRLEAEAKKRAAESLEQWANTRTNESSCELKEAK